MTSILDRFARDDKGNIAMLFGLFLIPLLAIGGIALDFLNLQRVRTTALEAADGAILAAARAHEENASLTRAQIEEIAWKFFRSNTSDPAPDIITRDAFTLSMSDETSHEKFRININGTLDTHLLAVVGRPQLPVTIVSEAMQANPGALEIALVLDNTYSMVGTKISTLQQSASELVDTLMADPAQGNKVALIPFAQYVNVGLHNRNRHWIDVPDDTTETGMHELCSYQTQPVEGQTCEMRPSVCPSIRDGVRVDKPCDRLFCNGVMVEPVYICEIREATISRLWSGCVGSRPYPYDTSDTGYDIERVPGLQGVHCPKAITPLTTERQMVKFAIGQMIASSSETYTPTGLLWGYRALTPEAPFDEAASFEEIANQGGRKILILMSGGENTVSAQYPEHFRNDDGAAANTLMGEICTNIKNADIELYTIAFEVSDQQIRDYLQDCASDAGHFYDAQDSDALRIAFKSIARSLSELALVR